MRTFVTAAVAAAAISAGIGFAPIAAATPAQGQGADAGQDAGPAVGTATERQGAPVRGWGSLAANLQQRGIRLGDLLADAGEGGGLRVELNNQLIQRDIRRVDILDIFGVIFGNGR